MQKNNSAANCSALEGISKCGAGPRGTKLAVQDQKPTNQTNKKHQIKKWQKSCVMTAKRGDDYKKRLKTRVRNAELNN